MTRSLPAEFDPHERTVMCWPARQDLYGARFEEAERAHALVANTIVEFEPVTMLVDPLRIQSAERICDQRVEVVAMEMDDSWFRDTGPIYTKQFLSDGLVQVIATDWVFNGWGEKFVPFDRDATLANRWAEYHNDAIDEIEVVLEGGSVISSGNGVIVTTEQCLLNPNRNPQLDRISIESVILEHLGASKMIWLPYGLALDDDTDGHVDNVAAFADTNTLLVQMCDDPNEIDHQRLLRNRSVIDAFTSETGEKLRVVEIPVLPFKGAGKHQVSIPYLNLYIGNGFVLVPVAGHEADSAMLAIIDEVFVGREVIALEVGEVLAIGGGGIHCITQQIPAV